MQDWPPTKNIQWILVHLINANRHNKKYPTGWRLRKRGIKADYVIWFQVPKCARHLWEDKSEVKLGSGRTLGQAEKEAYLLWSTKMVSSEKPQTLGQLFNRYKLTVLPNKKTSQRESNTYSLARITVVLDMDMPVEAFKPHHAFQYREGIHKSHSAGCANKDLETLSHAFTKAIEWGADMRHPIKDTVRKLPVQGSDRYVTDDELNSFLSVSNHFLNVYCPLKLATGKDQIELLRLQLSDISDHGIDFGKRKKTNVGLSFLPFMHEGNSTGLKEILNDIFAWRKEYLKPGFSSLYLFCNKRGKPMFTEMADGHCKTSAFKSQWQRAMAKALKQTDLTLKFTEHNLRAKTASDIDNAEEARKLLQHASVNTTKKVYIRTPQTVIPFKPKKLP